MLNIRFPSSRFHLEAVCWSMFGRGISFEPSKMWWEMRRKYARKKGNIYFFALAFFLFYSSSCIFRAFNQVGILRFGPLVCGWLVFTFCNSEAPTTNAKPCQTNIKRKRETYTRSHDGYAWATHIRGCSWTFRKRLHAVCILLCKIFTYLNLHFILHKYVCCPLFVSSNHTQHDCEHVCRFFLGSHSFPFFPQHTVPVHKVDDVFFLPPLPPSYYFVVSCNAYLDFQSVFWCSFPFIKWRNDCHGYQYTIQMLKSFVNLLDTYRLYRLYKMKGGLTTQPSIKWDSLFVAS